MIRPLRIAIGGIHIESSTFSPYRSGETDFRVTRGDDLLERYPWIVPGLIGSDFEPFDGIDWVPLIHARALPGGSVDPGFFDDWAHEFFGGLHRAMDDEGLDGVILDLHGALATANYLDPEGYIARKVREIVGRNVVVSASLDLHGNVSDELFDAVDFLTAYRTAPHVDELETRYRACTHLIHQLRSPRTIHRAKIDVPVLLPGEKTSTQVEPGASLYATIADLVDGTDVVDVAVLMGFPWADQPRCHGAVVATGYNRSATERAAGEMANHFWKAAGQFEFVGPAAPSNVAIRKALESSAGNGEASGPVFLSDTGDNPGAGGIGDLMDLTAELYSAWHEAGSRQRVVIASIFDPVTVDHAQALGLGQESDFEIGAKLATKYGPPMSVQARVTRLFDSPDYGGQCCVLTIEGSGHLGEFDAREESMGFHVIVTRERAQFRTGQAFELAGFPLHEAEGIIVVKMGYLEPDLEAAASRWIMALTPGVVDQDLTRLPYEKLRRPLVPFDPPTFDPALDPRYACRSCR